MNENVRIANMTWMEYDHLVKETVPVVMVPVGAVEQHRPHLPLATDTLVPTAVCERVAGQTGSQVAPPDHLRLQVDAFGDRQSLAAKARKHIA